LHRCKQKLAPPAGLVFIYGVPVAMACTLPQVGAHFAKDAFSSFVVNPLGNAVQDQVRCFQGLAHLLRTSTPAAGNLLVAGRAVAQEDARSSKRAVSAPCDRRTGYDDTCMWQDDALQHRLAVRRVSTQSSAGVTGL
jgi:hypothetical protein